MVASDSISRWPPIPYTVANYLKRAEDAGISWPLPEGMTEPELQARLFPQAKVQETSGSPSKPDWNIVHQELQKKGVTLFLLWEEYKNANPDGCQYSWFCREYRNWRGKLASASRLIKHLWTSP